MAEPSAIAGLPASLQTAFTIAAGLATFVVATVSYLRNKKLLPPAVSGGSGGVEATVIAGAFAGTDQMRLLLESLKRIEGHLEIGNGLTEQFGDAEDRTTAAIDRLCSAYDRVEKAVRADTEEHSRNSRDLALAIHSLAQAPRRGPL